VSCCRPSEQAAVRNRLREVGYDTVARAILGAGANQWLRRGRARSAFAFVFASASSIERFALEGDAVEREQAAADSAAAQRVEAERRNAEIDELWRRSEWVPRTAPQGFVHALERGDLAAAEAILVAHTTQPAGIAVADPDPVGDTPTHVAPTLARNMATLLMDATDAAERAGIHTLGVQKRTGTARGRQTRPITPLLSAAGSSPARSPQAEAELRRAEQLELLQQLKREWDTPSG
jgi:hypothetical protein